MDATTVTHLQCLARYLAGEFENRQQALADPAWYVHLRLWHQPIASLSDEHHLYFYAEQASVARLEFPYRPRIFCLTAAGDRPLTVRYASLDTPDRYRGAGLDPDRLQGITADNFQFLDGCALQVTIANDSEIAFQARPAPQDRCYFLADGQRRQVQLGFDAGRDRFNSYDKGIDPETGRGLWGALMGPFRFLKSRDFSDRLRT